MNDSHRFTLALGSSHTLYVLSCRARAGEKAYQKHGQFSCKHTPARCRGRLSTTSASCQAVSVTHTCTYSVTVATWSARPPSNAVPPRERAHGFRGGGAARAVRRAGERRSKRVCVWYPRAFMVLLLTRVPSPCALAVRRAMDVVRKQPAARGERELERLCVWERGCVCELEREAGVGRVCGLAESRACLCGREREAYAWLCAAFARAGWLACVQAQRWPAHGRRALFYSELSLLLLCVCVAGRVAQARDHVERS